MFNSNCIKIFFYLNFFYLVIIVIYLIINSKNDSSLPAAAYSISSRHGANHPHTYNNSLDQCDIGKPLTDEEKSAFQTISDTLITLRTRMIPYPNEYFQGRGIVLTTGSEQLDFAKINLKMLELTGTQLPVQVTNIIEVIETVYPFYCRYGTHMYRFQRTV